MLLYNLYECSFKRLGHKINAKRYFSSFISFFKMLILLLYSAIWLILHVPKTNHNAGNEQMIKSNQLSYLTSPHFVYSSRTTLFNPKTRKCRSKTLPFEPVSHSFRSTKPNSKFHLHKYLSLLSVLTFDFSF